MLFPKKALVAVVTLVVVSPVVGSLSFEKFFCCPDDDFEDDEKEYFGECEGCYLVPSPEADQFQIYDQYSCLNDVMFFNYPGFPARRLEELDLTRLPSALAKGARFVELDSGRQVIEISDGRRLVPFPSDLPKDHRSLQSDEDPPTYPGKITPYEDCKGITNELCCCDLTGIGPVGYKYEACVEACYFFDRDECALLAKGDTSELTPRGPLEVFPTCDGTFKAEECKPGLGLGGLDPHFRTWAGDWFDFHGECDLVFLTTQRSELGPLDIYIRTKIRYDYSFIKNAVLRMGNSTLEVFGFGQYLLDGVSQATMPAKLAGHLVTYEKINEKEYLLLVHLPGKERIALSTFKDWVTIKIENAGYKNFQGSLGLMGKYPHGDLVGRDGSTIFQDHNAFGQEWQVSAAEPKLFQANSIGPKYPQESCIMPNGKAPPRVGQTIAKEAARKACAESTMYEGHVDLCVSDVLLSRDIDIAGVKI